MERESGQQPARRVDVAVQGAVGHGGIEGDVAGEPALAQRPHGGDQLAGQDDLERFRRGEGGAGRLGVKLAWSSVPRESTPVPRVTGTAS